MLIIRNLAGQSYALYQLFSDNIFGLQGYNDSFVLSLVAIPRCCIAADCDGVRVDRLQPLQPTKGCCD